MLYVCKCVANHVPLHEPGDFCRPPQALVRNIENDQRPAVCYIVASNSYRQLYSPVPHLENLNPHVVTTNTTVHLYSITPVSVVRAEEPFGKWQRLKRIAVDKQFAEILLQRIEIIRPGLHHPDPLLPKVRPVVRFCDLVSCDVRKLAVDDLMPIAKFLLDRTHSQRAKPMP